MSLNRSESRAIASRYVSAMFELAVAQSQQEKEAADLNELKSIIESSSELLKLINNPVVVTEDKVGAFTEILKKAGASALTVEHVAFVIRNHRVDVLPDIADLYQHRLSAYKGEREVEITSASALSAAQVKEVKTALSKATGHDVHMSFRVDPSILGGLIIKLGSRMLDRSLAGRLQRLQATLRASAGA